MALLDTRGDDGAWPTDVPSSSSDGLKKHRQERTLDHAFSFLQSCPVWDQSLPRSYYKPAARFGDPPACWAERGTRWSCKHSQAWEVKSIKIHFFVAQLIQLTLFPQPASGLFGHPQVSPHVVTGAIRAPLLCAWPAVPLAGRTGTRCCMCSPGSTKYWSPAFNISPLYSFTAWLIYTSSSFARDSIQCRAA